MFELLISQSKVFNLFHCQSGVSNAQLDRLDTTEETSMKLQPSIFTYTAAIKCFD